jgi:mono/diheme cytochrome c family protein
VAVRLPPVPTGAAGSKLPLPGKQGVPGPAAEVVGNPEHGKVLYIDFCQACHGTDGGGGVVNPGSAEGKVPALRPIESEFHSPDALVFARNIDRVIQHGSLPEGPGPAFVMLAFGDPHTMTQQQISQVEAYVLWLNGVDRAQVREPGVSPPAFFVVTLALFVVCWAGLGAWRGFMGGGPRAGGTAMPRKSPAVFALVMLAVVVVVGSAAAVVLSRLPPAAPAAAAPEAPKAEPPPK